MTEQELYLKLKDEFKKIIDTNKLNTGEIKIRSVSLSPQEAIGITERKDYPILYGREIMLQAEYDGFIGQAFTSSPADYSGSLSEILDNDIIGDPHDRALFIAAMNAVMRSVGLADRTVHCKNQGPELCAKQMVPFIKEKYGNPKILQVGYQPAIFQQIAENFDMRILDLNPDNVGSEKYGVTVEHGIDDYDDAVNWADIILCTGSTICNGSIVKYIDIGKEVIFYGTTLAGAAELLGLKRACFESE
ncbi:MAG: hypothetical protein HFE90_03885 [Firmicutes bacterium]|nr:hypothetical protein [Bacillota bacterium]